ncbi:MAG: hypothetical protein V3U92_12890 [Cellulophaga sp.]
MLLLHQVVPHLHHEHEDSHTHSDIVHHDDHHHHDAPEKEDNSKKGFIDFLLAMHSHSAVANDSIIVLKETISNKTVVKKDISNPISPIYSIVPIDYRDIEKPPIYHPPNTYFNLYFTSLDSRGPPTLG